MTYDHVLADMLTQEQAPYDLACKAVDPVSGSVCTRPEHVDLRHSDDSDWGVIFKWNEKPDKIVTGPYSG